MTVTLTGATAKASGQITVKEGKKTLATKTLANGTVTFKLPKLKVGKHTLVISWPGDANGNSGTLDLQDQGQGDRRTRAASLPRPRTARARAPSGARTPAPEQRNTMNAVMTPESSTPGRNGLAELRAVDITAWFGDHKVLDRVSLTMPAGGITALIGPSGLRQVDLPADPQPDARAGARPRSWPARSCSTARTSTTPAGG